MWKHLECSLIYLGVREQMRARPSFRLCPLMEGYRRLELALVGLQYSVGDDDCDHYRY
jgi:hypothetical protein